jgi:hypothetical protein
LRFVVFFSMKKTRFAKKPERQRGVMSDNAAATRRASVEPNLNSVPENEEAPEEEEFALPKAGGLVVRSFVSEP